MLVCTTVRDASASWSARRPAAVLAPLFAATGFGQQSSFAEPSPRPSRTALTVEGEYIRHYNRGGPHSALGPGIPEPPQAKVRAGPHRHKLPKGYRVTSTPVLGGLHHEYGLEKEAA